MSDFDERDVAAELFNSVWELLDQAERTPAEDDRMLHMAHASRFHWDATGTAINLVRGEWQVSRVYATLRRAEPARWHAERALHLCAANDIADFDLAFCHEALARAHAVAGDHAQAAVEAEKSAAVHVADAEDAELLRTELATIPTIPTSQG